MRTRVIDLPPGTAEPVPGPSALRWHSAGWSIIGVGTATTLAVERGGGPPAMAAAMARFRDAVDVPADPETDAARGSQSHGPVAFAAFPFAPRAPGELVVPEITWVGRPDGGATLVTVAGATSCDVSEALARIGAHAAAPVEPREFTMRSAVAPQRWRDEIVTPVRDRIRAGALVKAVLARELRIDTDVPVDAAVVVERLRATHPGTHVFSVDGFVGASPELLVAREGDTVRAHPLAGTTARRADPHADRAAAEALLGSAKDRWEHRITIDWLLDELLPFCSYVDAEPNPSVVSLPNVHHLGTRVEGRLSGPPASILELVAALHPTPAVGGSPQAEALALIDEFEGADRGRYAGPVGWVDAVGNGEFAVGIRSAELDGTTARVFAGVGVVADSDPDAELAETRAKFQAMLGALVRP